MGLILKRNPVPSGSFVISKKKNEVLDAYLGTCIGVTLVDKKKNLGGLMHILLPEPSGTSIIGRAENYAITGLPIFINELRDRLNGRGDLVATLAGGALVGPVSNLDLNLDIGGRTAEIVEGILKANDIPVVKSETGGHFCCCLSLNLSNWESSIKPISVPDAGNGESFDPPLHSEYPPLSLSKKPSIDAETTSCKRRFSPRTTSALSILSTAAFCLK